MKRIYQNIKTKTITKLKDWLIKDEIIALQETYTARRAALEQEMDLDTLISLKINSKVKIKPESSLDKLTPQKLQVILSQAPPLESNDLLKLIIDDLKVLFMREIILNQFENSANLSRGKLIGLLKFEEEVEKRIGEFHSLNGGKGDNFNRFDIIS